MFVLEQRAHLDAPSPLSLSLWANIYLNHQLPSLPPPLLFYSGSRSALRERNEYIYTPHVCMQWVHSIQCILHIGGGGPGWAALLAAAVLPPLMCVCVCAFELNWILPFLFIFSLDSSSAPDVYRALFSSLSIGTIQVQLYVHIHTFLSISYCDAGSRSSRVDVPFKESARVAIINVKLDWIFGLRTFNERQFLFLPLFSFSSSSSSLPSVFHQFNWLTSQQEGQQRAAMLSLHGQQWNERERERDIYIQLCIKRRIHPDTLCCCCCLPTNRLLIYCWMTAAAAALWWSRRGGG